MVTVYSAQFYILNIRQGRAGYSMEDKVYMDTQELIKQLCPFYKENRHRVDEDKCYGITYYDSATPSDLCSKCILNDEYHHY